MKKRNPIAKALRNPALRPRVVQDKRRKKRHKKERPDDE